jgi:hypothetical protein
MKNTPKAGLMSSFWGAVQEVRRAFNALTERLNPKMSVLVM